MAPESTTRLGLGNIIVESCRELATEGQGGGMMTIGSVQVPVTRLGNFTTGDPTFDVFDLKKQTLLLIAVPSIGNLYRKKTFHLK